ncbi:hypothetical protein P6F34_gp87 [Pseudomonas phage MiCath]|uniref:Phage neck terminator protein gp12-like domain-containing protein n=1 Tax=Pseudomonas phage MiCath TaxID=3003729 RepID=A0A9Y1MTX6_9CAUD|nr:hypothetical protein P6F34_gp87 [Pseudomonas phage MiCath]WAX22451.1 hypothetical protein [Pseudomonas phage MiCath]
MNFEQQLHRYLKGIVLPVLGVADESRLFYLPDSDVHAKPFVSMYIMKDMQLGTSNETKPYFQDGEYEPAPALPVVTVDQFKVATVQMNFVGRGAQQLASTFWAHMDADQNIDNMQLSGLGLGPLRDSVDTSFQDGQSQVVERWTIRYEVYYHTKVDIATPIIEQIEIDGTVGDVPATIIKINIP